MGLHLYRMQPLSLTNHSYRIGREIYSQTVLILFLAYIQFLLCFVEFLLCFVVVCSQYIHEYPYEYFHITPITCSWQKFCTFAALLGWQRNKEGLEVTTSIVTLNLILWDFRNTKAK